MHDVKSVVSALAEDLSTPRSLTVAILLRNDEWDQLVKLRVDPLQYDCPDKYWADACITEILRKCAGLPTSIDTAEVARKGFWDTEVLCAHTNLRLEPFLVGAFPDEDPFHEHVFNVIHRARSIVANALGLAPDFKTLNGVFGKGSVVETKRSRTLVPDKVSGIPTLTPSALKCIPSWAQTAWGRNVLLKGGQINLVDGNRYGTVPKDATKDRSIGVEPSINGFYQRALGVIIRNRLLGIGINLHNGQDLHRRLAEQNSLTGEYATIDLSSASDCLSINLVKLLVPDDWYELLSALRSPYTIIDGNRVRLEKFSSMGNGFTFELETLIFWALLEAVRRSLKVSGRNYVYGDDIITPVCMARPAIAVLRYFGFKTNERKTFVSGHFRESCGGDYFKGVNVRPHNLEEVPNEPHEYISLANGLRRAGSQNRHSGDLDPRFVRAWLRVLRLIPASAKVYGPPDLGDIVIHAPRAWWKVKYSDSVTQIMTWSPTGKLAIPLTRWDDDTILTSLLYGASAEARWEGPKGVLPDLITGLPRGTIPVGYYYPRDCVYSYSRKWVAYS